MWKGTSDNLAEMKVTGFDNSTTSPCTDYKSLKQLPLPRPKIHILLPHVPALHHLPVLLVKLVVPRCLMYVCAGAKASGAEASSSAALFGGIIEGSA